jgi:hypothetical protein
MSTQSVRVFVVVNLHLLHEPFIPPSYGCESQIDPAPGDPQSKLPLSLLVLGVDTDDTHNTMTMYDLALVADFLD